MNSSTYTALGMALVLAACQTNPRNAALEEARSAVSTAAADPAANTAAPTELERARDALAAAERAWEAGDDEETRSRAYIARQRATIASEVGARHTTEQSLKQTATERERIRSEARAREAQVAEQRARDATQQAASAQAQADAERQRAEAQQRQLQQERERAQRMEQDLAALSAKATERGVVVTLQDVLFDTGKAQLRSGGVRSIERIADVLKKYPERRVLVEGFTDSEGSEEYNMDLAARRAAAVRTQLESLGVPDDRVEMRAYGEAYPVADNSTPSGRQQNRRVEIVFSDPGGKFPSSR